MSSDNQGVNLILDLLDDNPLTLRYDVLLYENTNAKFQLKLRIEFIDYSVLFTNDYIGSAKRKYAFQWQQADGTWLIRWDNAPHFPKIMSYPHHKHDYRSGSEMVTESYDITLVEVISYIQKQLQI